MPKTPAKPRPVGRPKTRPTGSRFRGIWLTDAEWAAVRALVKSLRRPRQESA